MKKSINLIIFIGLIALIIMAPNVVSAANITGELKFCEKDGVLISLKVIGVILTVVRVGIPILLIIMGMIDFTKAIITKDAETGKAWNTFIKRGIAAMLIYFIPALIINITKMVEESSGTIFGEYKVCVDCLLDDDKCPKVRRYGE